MQFGESKSLLAITILMKIAQFKGKILGPSENFGILGTIRFTHPDRFYIEFGSNPHKDWLRSGCSPMSTGSQNTHYGTVIGNLLSVKLFFRSIIRIFFWSYMRTISISINFNKKWLYFMLNFTN